MLPFRNNPEILTNWYNVKTKLSLIAKIKKSYYGISIKEKSLVIDFQEEKKRLGGSQEEEREWKGCLAFDIDSQFAKDLKMFLNEHIN